MRGGGRSRSMDKCELDWRWTTSLAATSQAATHSSGSQALNPSGASDQRIAATAKGIAPGMPPGYVPFSQGIRAGSAAMWESCITNPILTAWTLPPLKTSTSSSKPGRGTRTPEDTAHRPARSVLQKPAGSTQHTCQTYRRTRRHTCAIPHLPHRLPPLAFHPLARRRCSRSSSILAAVKAHQLCRCHGPWQWQRLAACGDLRERCLPPSVTS